MSQNRDDWKTAGDLLRSITPMLSPEEIKHLKAKERSDRAQSWLIAIAVVIGLLIIMAFTGAFN